MTLTPAYCVTAFVMIVASCFLNISVRYEQGQVWQTAPAIMEINGALTFSTADAPYFLSHASAAKKGMSPQELESKRFFSTSAYSKHLVETRDDIQRPLLSTVIAYFSKSAEIPDVLNTAHKLTLITAGLTALMVVVAFGAAGYWIEGAIAAVGGGLSSAYIVRSSFGRIDTDQLNLGLLYLIFGLLLLSAKATTPAKKIAFCTLAGFAAYIFDAWYGKPELILIATVSFLWLMLSTRHKLRHAFAYCLLFFSFAPHLIDNPLNSYYIQETITKSHFILPNTFETITEAQKLSASQILVSATGSVEMGIVCLFGLVLWLVRHPRIAIGYGPLLAFAPLAFFLGNRFIFYAAPILWFGGALLLTTIARFVYKRAIEGREDREPGALMHSLVIGSAMLGLLITWTNSPTSYVPQATFPRTIMEGFYSLQNVKDKQNSVVATWWDYGHASLFMNDIPTLHDGGSHNKPTTHFVAKALLSRDQKESVGILQFLATEGVDGIHLLTSKRSLYEKFQSSDAFESPEIYLVLTNQMSGWMPSISRLANWDIETGEYDPPVDNPSGPILNYMVANCDYRQFPGELYCRTGLGILNTEVHHDQNRLMSWVWSKNGIIKETKSLNGKAPFILQSNQYNNRLNTHVLHRDLYQSTFNKLFHLGQIEDKRIKLLVDNYPYFRIYKINRDNH